MNSLIDLNRALGSMPQVDFFLNSFKRSHGYTVLSFVSKEGDVEAQMKLSDVVYYSGGFILESVRVKITTVDSSCLSEIVSKRVLRQSTDNMYFSICIESEHMSIDIFCESIACSPVGMAVSKHGVDIAYTSVVKG